jgi:cytochrome c-type biogenesis protein CcsB
MKLLILLISLIYNQSSLAYNLYFCDQNYEAIPVLQGGRVKPLHVLASESLKFISDKTSAKGLTASQTFCLLTTIAFGLEDQIKLKVRVDHQQTKELIGLAPNENFINASELMTMFGQLQAKYQTLKINDSFKKDINKTLLKLEMYQSIISGQMFKLAQLNADKTELTFLPIIQVISKEKIENSKQTGSLAFSELILQSQTIYDTHTSDKAYLVELKYKKWHLFSLALIIGIICILLAILIKNPSYFISLSIISVLIQLIAITMRVYISGRAPITNMYETVMFSGLGALILALIIYSYKKDKTFVIGGLSYNILCLMMMNFAHDMLDPSISPLVPVLRDNFWLSTHVTTVILSYAALALSWMLANITLINHRLGLIDQKEYNLRVDQIYSAIKYGVVLLSAGIILGGVWADYSWGRFWGWDPKETWSLIVLLIYMAILHGKYSSWITPKRFVPMVAAAFMSVMMAWFGVNYILASGLHSYGFSEGGAVFLGSFFALQIVILIISKRKMV